MPQGHPVRALVVDDDAVFRELLTAIIRTRFPSMEIYQAEGISDGHRKAGKYAPQLVILDIRLPDGNGLELAKRLGTELPGATVAMCSGYDLVEYREAASRCGAGHFVSKTQLDPQQVIEVVEETLDRLRDRDDARRLERWDREGA